MLENDPIDLAIEAMQNAPEPPAIPPLGIITPTLSTPVFDNSGADPVVTVIDGQLTLVGSQPLGSQIGSQPVVVSASTSAAVDTLIDATINQLFNGPPTPVVVLTPIVFNTPSPPPLPPLTPINVTFASDDPPPIVSPFTLPAVNPISTTVVANPANNPPVTPTSPDPSATEAEVIGPEFFQTLNENFPALFDGAIPIIAANVGSGIGFATVQVDSPLAPVQTFNLPNQPQSPIQTPFGFVPAMDTQVTLNLV